MKYAVYAILALTLFNTWLIIAYAREAFTHQVLIREIARDHGLNVDWIK